MKLTRIAPQPSEMCIRGRFQDGVQCACPFPNGSIPPQQGAKVFVRITVQDTEHRRLYGLITHVESSM